MRTPLNISREEIAPFVEGYIREVKRIRRAGIREAIIQRCQEEGEESPEGEEMETEIDVLEGLQAADLDDPDKLLHFFVEIGLTPEGDLSVEQQILKGLENRRARAEAQVIDDATLDQYRFEVTGKIMVRCQKCRKGYNRTEQKFRRDRHLQRILLGEPVTCLYCHTGHMKVYGVRAVRGDRSLSQEREI